MHISLKSGICGPIFLRRLTKPPFISSLCLLLIMIPAHRLTSQSFYRYQRAGQWNIYGGAGLTKYFGELSDEKKLGDINPYLTLGINIPLKTRWSLRPEISYYRISAADSDLLSSDSRHQRNLSFRSDNFELCGLLVYGLHAPDQRLKRSKLRPYVQAGLGITYINPRAQLNNRWHALQPLETEGVSYSKFQLVVPLGFGLGVQVSSRWQLALEMNYRFTFTDYLDDVSTRYRDSGSFSDPLAAMLADRRPEIGLDKAPAGSTRGNSKTNDGYLLFGFKAFHQLAGRGPVRRKR